MFYQAKMLRGIKEWLYQFKLFKTKSNAEIDFANLDNKPINIMFRNPLIQLLQIWSTKIKEWRAEFQHLINMLRNS